MSVVNNGGPAYPVAEDHKIAADIPWTAGMTLRDYFAGKALTGVITFWNNWEDANPDSVEMNQPLGSWIRRAAVESYHYADAMLEARDHGKGE